MILRIIVTFKKELKHEDIVKIIETLSATNKFTFHNRRGEFAQWLDVNINSIYIENFIYDVLDIADEIKIVNE